MPAKRAALLPAPCPGTRRRSLHLQAWVLPLGKPSLYARPEQARAPASRSRDVPLPHQRSARLHTEGVYQASIQQCWRSSTTVRAATGSMLQNAACRNTCEVHVLVGIQDKLQVCSHLTLLLRRALLEARCCECARWRCIAARTHRPD